MVGNAQGTTPPKKTRDKGNPIEGDPKKVIPLVDSLEIPLHLNTPAFKRAIEEWADYLGGLKRSSKGSLVKTIQYQLNRKLAGKTEPEAIELIENAIERRWQSFFESKPQSFNQNSKPQQQTTERNYESWKL